MSQLIASRFRILLLVASLLGTACVYAAIVTTVPISKELANNIAKNLFPVSAKVNEYNLFLSEPVVLFIDDKRIGLQLRVQAYDHRPQDNIAVSEMGRIAISGELSYDSAAREILLYSSQLDQLVFDQQNNTTKALESQLYSAWKEQVANPMRSEFPPHPYLLPFKENIRNFSYDGKNINLEIFYE